MSGSMTRSLKFFALGGVLGLVGLVLALTLAGPVPGASEDERALSLGPLEVSRIDYRLQADGTHEWKQTTNPAAIAAVFLIGGVLSSALAGRGTARESEERR